MNKCNLNKCILFSKLMQGKFSNLWWSVTRWGVFIPINMLNSPSPAAPESVSWNQQSKPFAERNKMHRHQGQTRQVPLLLHKSPTSALCWQNVPAAGKWTNFYSLLPGQRSSPWREGELPVLPAWLCLHKGFLLAAERQLCLFIPPGHGGVLAVPHSWQNLITAAWVSTLNCTVYFWAIIALRAYTALKIDWCPGKKSSNIYFWL